MFKTLKLIYLYLTVLNLSIFTLSARAEITQQIDLNKPVISIDLYRYYRYSNLLDKLRETEIKISENSLKFREDSSVIQVLQQQKQNLLDLLDREWEQILSNAFQPPLSSRQEELLNQIQTIQIKIAETSPNFTEDTLVMQILRTQEQILLDLWERESQSKLPNSPISIPQP